MIAVDPPYAIAVAGYVDPQIVAALADYRITSSIFRTCDCRTSAKESESRMWKPKPDRDWLIDKHFGAVDSFTIVDLMLETEGRIEEAIGRYVPLADETIFDAEKSPLKTGRTGLPIWRNALQAEAERAELRFANASIRGIVTMVGERIVGFA